MLQSFVPQKAAQDGFPIYFLSNVRLLQTIPPTLAQMQTMLASRSTFVMTAFAATDIYPHTYGLPVVVVLQKIP